MGILTLFKKKDKLSDEQKKQDKIWSLWAEGHADSPYAELMTYQSEINNGGHDQYFFNTGQTGDLQKEMRVLETVLPVSLQNNLRVAYKAYLELAENQADGKAEATLKQCDGVFYKNEEEINCILKEYASKIKL